MICSLVSNYLHTNSIIVVLIISLPIILFISHFTYKYIELLFIDLGGKTANSFLKMPSKNITKNDIESK
jgi:peptidoglycan/LPS O-acetylase OafA/YrhL